MTRGYVAGSMLACHILNLFFIAIIVLEDACFLLIFKRMYYMALITIQQQGTA